MLSMCSIMSFETKPCQQIPRLLSTLDMISKRINRKLLKGTSRATFMIQVANMTSVVTSELRAIMRVCFPCDVIVLSEVARCCKDIYVGETSHSRWSE